MSQLSSSAAKAVASLRATPGYAICYSDAWYSPSWFVSVQSYYSQESEFKFLHGLIIYG